MKIAQSIPEYLESKRAQHLSPRTLEDYEGILHKFAREVGERDVADIEVKDVRHYLASLTVSKKRVKNVHITLSSFWTWAVSEGICVTHIPRLIKPPKPEKRVIVPIRKPEIEAMLDATQYSVVYMRRGKRDSQNKLANTLRDRAIIFFLLDTGVRASELCQLCMNDVGYEGACVHGKGSKDRIVPVSSSTRNHLKTYTSRRKRKGKDFVFLTQDARPLTSDSLRSIIVRVSERAGLLGVHPHRFRHTFAINFLRNGGDIFSLQAILGHETFDMVKRYLAIAQLDIQEAHRKASPVSGWHLDTYLHDTYLRMEGS